MPKRVTIYAGLREGGEMKLKFEPLPQYIQNAKLLGRPLAEHESYFRENNGDWIITDEAGERVGTVTFRGKAKRGQAWNAPDPEGLAIAKEIVRRWNLEEK